MKPRSIYDNIKNKDFEILTTLRRGIGSKESHPNLSSNHTKERDVVLYGSIGNKKKAKTKNPNPTFRISIIVFAIRSYISVSFASSYTIM